MADQVLYFFRGFHGSTQYKMVSGEIKRTSEARGEDRFESRHDAVFHFARALRKWRYLPQGIKFDLCIQEPEAVNCPPITV